jgi:hypothetical protein
MSSVENIMFPTNLYISFVDRKQGNLSHSMSEFMQVWLIHKYCNMCIWGIIRKEVNKIKEWEKDG